MKSIIISLLLLLYASPVRAEPTKQVVKSFVVKATKLQNFFANKPIALISENTDRGIIFTYGRFNFIGFSYDIQASSSLITPYIGYIDVRYKYETNSSCGNSQGKNYTYGFTTRELAISRKLDCFKMYNFTTPSRMIFVYQDEEWVLKDIDSGDTRFPETILKGAFGIPNPGSNRVEENTVWENAIK